MLRSRLETFSDEALLTATAISDFVIDLLPSGGAINAGAAGGPTANTTRNFGAGEVQYLHIYIATSFDSALDSTSLIVSLESSANTSLTASTVHWTSADVEQATLVAGYWFAKGIGIPPGTYQRYLGLRYTVGAEENFTAGAISAWLSSTRFNDEIYETARLTGVN